MPACQLTISAHVNSVCRSAYYQLCQLRPVVSSLSADAARTIVQAFVSSRLDYCNSLMYGVAYGLMQRLQAVQNAAARLVTGTRMRDHIIPVLRQLHWLPVCQRVNFKLAVLVFKALHGLAPCYLVDDCQWWLMPAVPTPFVRCRYMCTSTYQQPLWQSGVWSFRTICLEQSPHWTPPIWSFTWTIPPSAKNVFVLTGSVAPIVTVVLSAPFTNPLTYLLIYRQPDRLTDRKPVPRTCISMADARKNTHTHTHTQRN